MQHELACTVDEDGSVLNPRRNELVFSVLQSLYRVQETDEAIRRQHATERKLQIALEEAEEEL